MKDKIKGLLEDQLKENQSNFIIFFSDNKRHIKSYHQLSYDVDQYVNRLKYLISIQRLEIVGILGNTSYEWLVADLACIKAGVKSVALLETFSSEQLINISNECEIDILLVDYKLKEKVTALLDRTYFWGCDDCEKSFQKVLSIEGGSCEILEVYGIGFSSGTSERMKKLTFRFPKSPANNLKGVRKLFLKIKNGRSFWSKKNNKIIVFMPFSHFQQRYFVHQSLLLNINIILSDPTNCIKHIIIEKPNIMISVPAIYEVLARRIQEKLTRFSRSRKIIFELFKCLKVNRLSDDSLIKRLFSYILLRDIKKIYGGKADFFITGSAPINPQVLKTFFSIGVRIYEAYGQSESENISMTNKKNFRIGSVGKPGNKVKISENSEILIKYDDGKHSPNKSILNVDENGYIHTGDSGYLDKDGYLFLTGRIDDVILLQNGKKVSPVEIEIAIKSDSLVEYALVFSKNGSDLSCIISSRMNVKLPEFKSRINDHLIEINKAFPSYSKINSFFLAPVPFTVENGFLTATFKMKRNVIINAFNHQDFSQVNL